MRLGWFVLLAGCGRIGFDASNLDASAGLPDAPMMVGQFTDLTLPPGGHVRALVLDGSFDRYYVAYAGGRLFHVDNGTWTECATLADDPRAMSLASNGVLFAALDHLIGYSTDGCTSFTNVMPSTLVYAVGGVGLPTLFGSYDGLWTFDYTSGSSNPLASPFDSTLILDISAAPDGRLGVAAQGVFGVFRNAAWHTLATAPQWNYHVVFDPVNPSIVYAVGEGGIYKSTTSGDVFSVTPWTGYYDMLAVDAANNGRLLVMEGGALKQSMDDLGTLSGDVRNAVTGKTWPTAILFDPAMTGNVLMGSETGVFRAADSSLDWTRVDTMVNAWWVDSVAETSSALYACASGRLYVSEHHGPWIERGGQNAQSSACYGVTVDPTKPDRVYTSGDSLERSDDRGLSFSTLIPSTQTDGYIFSQLVEQGSRLWSASYGRLAYSDDGTTWMSVTLSGAAADVVLRVLVRSAGNQIVATTNQGVYWSIDNGATFAASNIGLTDLDLEGGVAELTDGQVVIGSADGIWASPSSGSAWSRMGFTGHLIRDLLATPSGALVAAVDDGVFVTRDGGTTWAEIPGLSTYRPWSLAIGQGNTLLVGTQGRGLFRTVLP